VKNIKHIIFDLGGVLLDIDYNKTEDALKKLGIKNVVFSKKSQDNLFNLIETGKISKKEFIDKLLSFSTTKKREEIIAAWNSILINLPKERIKLLKNLKNKFSIFLLSNTNEIHINGLKNLLGENDYNEFINLFDKIYYSHIIGIRKPSKEAFYLILEENNLNKKNVLFIDDSSQHIKSANNIGINTYHIKNEDVLSIFPDIIQ
tara:strand:+ start:105 stop:716 length:612 start_codon:yes stop_codon:yes gene_type:complete